MLFNFNHFNAWPQVINIALLVTSGIALTTITSFEDAAIEDGMGYEEADSYRGAAGWVLFVGSAAILFHVSMIIVRILYLASVVEKYIKPYGAIVSDY